ncbi:MAG: hypothetical protein APR63_10375 [Desulfuromonas sp. SDB]|nr:MAG: hypothetical protein APR63_10375 [Desulfuromonas sp. SDB]
MKLAFCRSSVSLFVLVIITLLPTNISACTGITITAEDGSVVYGRTMELGNDLVEWGLIVIPRSTSFTGSTPWGGPGASWKAKYAFTGVNAYNLPAVVDGVNEKGLAAGAFMFPNFVEYQQATEDQADITISSNDFVNWVLSNYSSVEELKAGLPQIKVTPVVFDEPGWGDVPPLHWFVVDKSGAAIVVEYVDGELNIHDNPVGVITNAPMFDWHLINLKNYVQLSPDAAMTRQLGNENITPVGRGSGMLGLPGDFTPPSRFVRAAYLKAALIPVQNATEGIKQIFHLLNQFDIPRGVIHLSSGDHPLSEQTDWTSGIDLENCRYYIHTAETRRIHVIDLLNSPLDTTEFINIPLPKEEVFIDLTP